MSDWIKIGVEFIKALPGQWKGSSDPNAPSEIVGTIAEEAPRAASVAVGDESQIGTTSEASPNQQGIAPAHSRFWHLAPFEESGDGCLRTPRILFF